MNASLTCNALLVLSNESTKATDDLVRIEQLLDSLAETGGPAGPYDRMRERRAQLLDSQGRLRLLGDMLAAEVRDWEDAKIEDDFEFKRDEAADRHFARTARPRRR